MAQYFNTESAAIAWINDNNGTARTTDKIVKILRADTLQEAGDADAWWKNIDTDDMREWIDNLVQ